MTPLLTTLRNKLAEKTAALATLADNLAAAVAQGQTAPKETEAALAASLEKEIESLQEMERKESARVEKQREILAAQANTTESLTQKPQPKTPPIVVRSAYAAKLRNFIGPDADKKAFEAGQYLRAIVFGAQDALSWCRDNLNQTEMLEPGSPAHSSNVGGAGGMGMFVPTSLSAAIIDLRNQYGVARQFARSLPMGTASMKINRRRSGLTAHFTGENQPAGTATTLSFDFVELVAKDLEAVTYIPENLSQDSPMALADIVVGEIAYAFAVKEDACFFNGDGTSTYGNILGVVPKLNDGSHAASIATAATGNLSFETLDMRDFHNAAATLPTYAQRGARWYFNRAGWAAGPERLMYAAGGNTTTTTAEGTQRQFLGYPVVFSETLNGTLSDQASTILCLFGDLGLSSTFGDRSGITIRSSSEAKFLERQLVVQGIERFDINNHDLGDNSTAGPVIALKTPAS